VAGGLGGRGLGLWGGRSIAVARLAGRVRGVPFTGEWPTLTNRPGVLVARRPRDASLQVVVSLGLAERGTGCGPEESGEPEQAAIAMRCGTAVAPHRSARAATGRRGRLSHDQRATRRAESDACQAGHGSMSSAARSAAAMASGPPVRANTSTAVSANLMTCSSPCSTARAKVSAAVCSLDCPSAVG
jgi:hypothetical protein